MKSYYTCYTFAVFLCAICYRFVGIDVFVLFFIVFWVWNFCAICHCFVGIDFLCAIFASLRSDRTQS